MKKKMMITCTVVLVTAAVILGFVLKNQVRENPDKNTVNVAIGQWGTTQNESQNYWNPDNHAVAKGMGGYYFIQTTDGISKIAFFDETTQEAVPVCAKPECTHSDNTCNAYLCDMKQTGSALYLTDTIYCYNGYLYLTEVQEKPLPIYLPIQACQAYHLSFMKMMSTHMMIPDMQVRRKKQKKLLKKFR